MFFGQEITNVERWNPGHGNKAVVLNSEDNHTPPLHVKNLKRLLQVIAVFSGLYSLSLAGKFCSSQLLSESQKSAE